MWWNNRTIPACTSQPGDLVLATKRCERCAIPPFVATHNNDVLHKKKIIFLYVFFFLFLLPPFFAYLCLSIPNHISTRTNEPTHTITQISHCTPTHCTRTHTLGTPAHTQSHHNAVVAQAAHLVDTSQAAVYQKLSARQAAADARRQNDRTKNRAAAKIQSWWRKRRLHHVLTRFAHTPLGKLVPSLTPSPATTTTTTTSPTATTTTSWWSQ